MSITDAHRLREAAQVALASKEYVEAVDVLEDTNGDDLLELTVYGNRVPPSILSALATFDCAIDPDRTATRGDPTHTVVVARP